MPQSRSPLQFFRRRGLTPQANHPAPRLAVDEIKLHMLPLVEPKPPWSVLAGVEGNPPPDRGLTRPWPDNPRDS